ncbi:MAG TPA: DMT family transporter [Bryobacteraceae bacterium]|jgi:drug/metabolite transporter (DMT)-like permease
MPQADLNSSDRKQQTLINICLLVLVNLMWAAQYPAYRVLSNQMGPVTASAWVFLFAAIALIPFLLRESRANGGTARRRLSVTRQDVFGFLIIGVLGLMPASALLAAGTERSTASNAALIYLAVPILTALLAAVLLNEKMTSRRWLGLAISLIGVFALSQRDLSSQSLTSLRFLMGNVLVLLACVSSAFYNVYSKRLLVRFSPLEILVYGYVIALAASPPFLVWMEPVKLTAIRAYPLETWIWLLILSILSWGIAMALWMFLLERLDVSQASISIYLLPFLGVLISALTLHEAITRTTIIGGAISLAGTVLATASHAPSGAVDRKNAVTTRV